MAKDVVPEAPVANRPDTVAREKACAGAATNALITRRTRDTKGMLKVPSKVRYFTKSQP